MFHVTCDLLSPIAEVLACLKSTTTSLFVGFTCNNWSVALKMVITYMTNELNWLHSLKQAIIAYNFGSVSPIVHTVSVTTQYCIQFWLTESCIQFSCQTKLYAILGWYCCLFLSLYIFIKRIWEMRHLCNIWVSSKTVCSIKLTLLHTNLVVTLGVSQDCMQY